MENLHWIVVCRSVERAKDWRLPLIRSRKCWCQHDIDPACCGERTIRVKIPPVPGSKQIGGFATLNFACLRAEGKINICIVWVIQPVSMKKIGYLPRCFAAWWICTTIYLQSSSEKNSILQFESKRSWQIKTRRIQAFYDKALKYDILRLLYVFYVLCKADLNMY